MLREFFLEERELSRHLEGLGEEPHGQVFGAGRVFLERLAVALEVLGQVVFARELVSRAHLGVVFEVVHALVRAELGGLDDLEPVAVGPEERPVFALGLLPAAACERLRDAVAVVGAVADVCPASRPATSSPGTSLAR